MPPRVFTCNKPTGLLMIDVHGLPVDIQMNVKEDEISSMMNI
jgi:hypothetical protein